MTEINCINEFKLYYSNDIKSAFDWEIWILKSGFWICNRTRNPKSENGFQH